MAFTSYFSQMIVELQARIEQQVPAIRFVNVDLGQLEMEKPPVSFPCSLIDFMETNYDTLGSQVQEGNTTINIRLAFPSFSNTSNITPAAVKDKGLQYFDIENELYKALQGWCPASGICQPLTRISAGSEKGREDNLRVRAMAFTTSFFDSEASPVIHRLKPSLEIEII